MTPTQQTALEALTGRPLSAAEVTMAQARQDATLAQSLSAGRTVRDTISIANFLAWSASTGTRAVIEDAAHLPGSPYYATLRSSALAMLDIINNKTDLDVSASQIGQGNVGMLNAWVTVGAITPAQEAALLALGVHPALVSADAVTTILNGA